MTTSGSYKAFTLVEVVTAIVIVAIIAAIAFPMWSSSKKKTTEQITVSALHQAWVALELYRQDNDPNGPLYGSSSEMGLPNVDGFYALLTKDHIDWWKPVDRIGYGPIYYPFDQSDFVVTSAHDFNAKQLASWIDYSETHQGDSVIIGDFNHTENCSKLQDPHCIFEGFGTDLNGSLHRKSAAGHITNPNWWDNK